MSDRFIFDNRKIIEKLASFIILNDHLDRCVDAKAMNIEPAEKRLFSKPGELSFRITSRRLFEGGDKMDPIVGCLSRI